MDIMGSRTSNALAMKRKVIQIGESTQLVSLPRQWALKNGVKKGDEMEIEENGSKLVLMCHRNMEPSKVTVDATGLDRDSLMFFIRALYKNGHDDITVMFKKKECENQRLGTKVPVLDVIRQEVSRLNGLEVFTQKADHCVIRTISEDTMKVFETMLRRIFLLAGEAIGEMIDGLEKGDPMLLSGIQGKHDLVTKFVSYCQRLLNKSTTFNYARTSLLYLVLDCIDAMMDFVKYNARVALDWDKNASITARGTRVQPLAKTPDASSATMENRPSAETIEICRIIHSAYTECYALFYTFDIVKIASLNQRRHTLLQKIEAAQRSVKKRDLAFITNMEQVADYILRITNARVSLEFI